VFSYLLPEGQGLSPVGVGNHLDGVERDVSPQREADG
jgi:hypothetical protein